MDMASFLPFGLNDPHPRKIPTDAFLEPVFRMSEDKGRHHLVFLRDAVPLPQDFGAVHNRRDPADDRGSQTQ